MADIFHISLHVAIIFFTFLSLRVAITFVTAYFKLIQEFARESNIDFLIVRTSDEWI
jgi:hypothetical protein